MAGLVIVGDDMTVAAGRPHRIQGLRQAEVEHLDRAVGSHLDVCRLEIAVDDPLFVRRFERLCDLAGDRQRVIDRNRSVGNAIGQCGPLDQFEHEGLHGLP